MLSMNQRRSGLGRRRTILVVVSAAGVALAAGVVIVQALERCWNGAPYPVAAPATTARRLDAHTQDVYDALGLPHAELADPATRRALP